MEDTAERNLLYILGWPVPEPLLQGKLMLDGSGGRGQHREVYNQWFDLLHTQVEAEKVSMQVDAEVRADSTTLLPDHVVLRVTPTDVVVLAKDDKDKAYACWAYQDLQSWSCPVGVELNLAVRNPTGAIRCVFKTTKAAKLKERLEEHVHQLLELKKADKKG